MFRNVIISVLCLVAHSLCAQDLGMGALEDSSAYAAVAVMPVYAEGQKGDAEMPTQRSLRMYCPIPAHQGTTSACAGFALGYGAMTILDAQQAGLTDAHEITKRAFSPWFVYHQIIDSKKGCNSSASMEAAIEVLKTKGICRLSAFEPSSGSCSELPIEAVKVAATEHQIKDAAGLFEWRATPERKVAAVKGALAGDLPVVMQMKVYASFMALSTGTQYWRMRTKENESYLGQHFVVVTGFDDRNQTFELMSSWGTAWADRGFVKVSYTDFAQICQLAYVIIPKNHKNNLLLQQPEPVPAQRDKPGPSQTLAAAPGSLVKTTSTQPTQTSTTTEAPLVLQGKFAFCRPTWNDTRGAWDYPPEPVKWNSTEGIYETVAPNYPVGTPFVLRTSGIPAGKYVYVFSLDPNGKAELHWPKTELRSTFMTGAHAVVQIPSMESALAVKHTGADYLAILISDEKLTDLPERLEALTALPTSAGFRARLELAFPSLLRRNAAAVYDAQQMSVKFQGYKRDGGVVGMVVRVWGGQ
jgi:Papain family cysteine protease